MRSAESILVALASEGFADDLVEELYQLGDRALNAAMACVLDQTADLRLRECCAEVAGRIVPGGAERLLDLLRTRRGDAADLAAWGLRWNHARDLAEGTLFSLLEDESATIRANAARALRYIHVNLSRCDPRLVNALQDRAPDVRLDALRAILELADVGLEKYGIADVTKLAAAVETTPHDADNAERDLRRALLDVLAKAPAVR